MRYKVKLTESLEFIIEGANEVKVRDWLRGNTIREVRAINHKLNPMYNEEILGKTVMPADVTTDDWCEDIIEDWEEGDENEEGKTD